MLTATNLSGRAGIRHGFLTRTETIDDMAAEPDCLVTARQVHSDIAVNVPTPWNTDDAPDADALVSDRAGIVLGILTADCAPVLFADASAGVVGAAHAGWRGALGETGSGVLESCVAAMVDLGASVDGIDAAIGPCIGAQSYEVGPEFHADFIDDDGANAQFFKPSINPEHNMFDLGGYVTGRLRSMGLASVEFLDCDTLGDEARFYSHRRGVLSGKPETGRLLSAIGIKGKAKGPNSVIL
ncbi:MAG: polyphenol oxidase family protein [Rhodospirillaceae bacterium]|jgi:polyphenol oxidase|nr:polyphenol oxidase family protein [Rhodospirillaceae bacterium]MBT4218586.1 polyphenol oxidase family protein [Rhodospirillaceae bacterium]MBT4464506.1 polyphenol oxidase family protein [Rhodospirillaceae bacterium]MBT5012881.1 polyphenol oxidase family protein [Rhodospirillaceae bacterium]MBT5307889.1 polyphenol oxidase family protein [Rhodospirillaceae bacterium]